MCTGQIICQVVALALLILGLLSTICTDCHGSEAKAARGFEGVLVTLVIGCAILAIFARAGTFSKLF